MFQKQLKSFRQECNLNSWRKTSEQDQASPGWWMQHRCCPMNSGNTSEFWGCSGGVDQPLAHPTTLQQSCVWGQQQCPSGTEVAANAVVSVQGKVNGGIQVSYALSFSGHLSCPLESRLSFAVGRKAQARACRRQAQNKLSAPRFQETLSIFVKLYATELSQAGFLKCKQ